MKILLVTLSENMQIKIPVAKVCSVFSSGVLLCSQAQTDQRQAHSQVSF